MTAPTEQFTEFASKAQEQVTAAVRTWADAVQTATGGFGTERPALVDPATAVEKYFDFAQQVLDKQREYAKAALAVTAKS